MEGIWLFSAGKSTDLPVRAKKKAKLGEIASWLKKSVTTAFEAKAPPLPAGTYQESCTGCRVHKLVRCRPMAAVTASASSFSLSHSRGCETRD